MNNQAQKTTYPPGPKLHFPWQRFAKNPTDLANTLLKLSEQYGDMVHFRLGRQHFYLLNHPDFIQEVLVNQHENFREGRTGLQADQLLGKGILTAEGQSHQRQRRIMQPYFYSQEITKYAPDIVQMAGEMCRGWQADQPLDLSAEMSQLCINVFTNFLSSSGDLSHLLDSGMEADQIRDHVATFFATGLETTASALSWTLYLLAQSPRVMDQLAAELDSLIAGNRSWAERYAQLTYCKMAFTESLRLYPPVWIISRQAQKTLSLGGYPIPKDAIVLISQWITHHDRRFYPDPYRFKPERWLPEARALRPKMAYFPFGGGQRLCLGKQFVWMLGVLTTATVLQSWRLEPIPGHKMEPDFALTLRPSEGYCVRPIPVSPSIHNSFPNSIDKE